MVVFFQINWTCRLFVFPLRHRYYYLEMFHEIIKDGDEFSASSASGMLQLFRLVSVRAGASTGPPSGGGGGGLIGGGFPRPFTLTSAKRSAKDPGGLCASGRRLNATTCDIGGLGCAAQWAAEQPERRNG